MKNRFTSASKVVIIDCGHGGINPLTKQYVTPGKRSKLWPDGTQLYEGVVNRIIGKLLASILVKNGWTVLFTVNPDDYTDVSLTKRIAISNAHFQKHPNAFQISIHSNGWDSPLANGTEVWTSIGQTKSDPMATIFLEEIKRLIPWLKVRPELKDGDPDKEGRLAINTVKCPSILIESMFHTNERECKYLLSSEGQLTIARSLAKTCERIHTELIQAA